MGRKKEESKAFLGLRPKQVKFVHLLASPEGHKLTVAEVCQTLKISKNTYYAWIKDEKVITAMHDQISRYASAYKTRAWNNLMACCDKHDVSAIKLYFQLVGAKVPDMHIQVTLGD